MKKLVIGASGTVGSALVAELSRRNLPTVAATREPSHHTFPEGVEKVVLDYADDASVKLAVAGVDHL